MGLNALGQKIAGFFIVSDFMNEVRNGVDFLLSDKHQSFLQVDTTIFGDPSPTCPDSQSNC